MDKTFKEKNTHPRKPKRWILKLIHKVEKQIDKLKEPIYRDKLYIKYLNGKYCIVCGNRDPKVDFKFPDGIVCTHPSNQKNKGKFRSYSHSCKFWKREKNFKKMMDKRFKKEYWESLKPFENEDDIPDIPICRTDEDRIFYKDVIVPNLIRCGAIAKKDLEVDAWYTGDTRNANRAKWNGKEFEYIRYKFGYTFTDTVNHFEDDDDCALFVPLKKEESITIKP